MVASWTGVGGALVDAVDAVEGGANQFEEMIKEQLVSVVVLMIGKINNDPVFLSFLKKTLKAVFVHPNDPPEKRLGIILQGYILNQAPPPAEPKEERDYYSRLQTCFGEELEHEFISKKEKGNIAAATQTSKIVEQLRIRFPKKTTEEEKDKGAATTETPANPENHKAHSEKSDDNKPTSTSSKPASRDKV